VSPPRGPALPASGRGDRIGLADGCRLWLAGFRLGVRCLRQDPALGLKRMVLPISYWRTAEFQYVLQALDLPPQATVLDLGSPKELGAILARDRGLRVTSTDILPQEVEIAGTYARSSARSPELGGGLTAELQDGRALTYPDDSFDAAFSVSVLEHIPDGGDSEAVGQLLRVVKPGGLVVFTVPFDREYRETFVASHVYERDFVGQPVFFERHYDEPTLRTRLLSMPARLVGMELWGEGRIRGERLLGSMGGFRAFVSPLESVLAVCSLRRVSLASSDHPMAAFVTLQKEPRR
jgi:SAM-dependent methyltransferase